MTRDLFTQALVALQPVLLLLISAGVAWLVPLIRRHIKNKLIAEALSAVVATTAVVVANAEQTVVEDLRNPARPGRLDDVTAAAVKARVLRDLRELGAHELAQLQKLKGLDSAGLEKLLEQLVEAKVLELKRGAPVVLDAAPPAGGAT